MKKIIQWLVICIFCTPLAHAELTIRVVKGVDDPTDISVVPFNFTGGGVLPEDVAKILSDDLICCGSKPSSMIDHSFGMI